MSGCRFAYSLVSNEADDEDEVEQGPNKNFGKYCLNGHVLYVPVVQNGNHVLYYCLFLFVTCNIETVKMRPVNKLDSKVTTSAEAVS